MGRGNIGIWRFPGPGRCLFGSLDLLRKSTLMEKCNRPFLNCRKVRRFSTNNISRQRHRSCFSSRLSSQSPLIPCLVAAFPCILLLTNTALPSCYSSYRYQHSRPTTMIESVLGKRKRQTLDTKKHKHPYALRTYDACSARLTKRLQISFRQFRSYTTDLLIDAMHIRWQHTRRACRRGVRAEWWQSGDQ